METSSVDEDLFEAWPDEVGAFEAPPKWRKSIFKFDIEEMNKWLKKLDANKNPAFQEYWKYLKKTYGRGKGYTVGSDKNG
jgi:hypothetical protein